MPAADEHVPPPGARDELIAKAVLPRIAECVAEVGCPQTFRGVIRVRGQDLEPFGVANGYWMIRVIVRHTHDAARDVFRVQALIPKHEQSGFCGFQMRGETIVLADRREVVVSGWTGLYNTTGNDDWS